MVALSARAKTTVIAAAAVALTGTAALGQQMANVNTDRATYITSQCGRIVDPVRQAGCSAEASINFDRAREIASKRESAALRTENECQQTLIQGIKGGQFSREDVRTVYAGRPVGSVPACDIVKGVQSLKRG
jgi:hypothetical protein